jgi:hypothetical protein
MAFSIWREEAEVGKRKCCVGVVFLRDVLVVGFVPKKKKRLTEFGGNEKGKQARVRVTYRTGYNHRQRPCQPLRP